MPLSLSLSLSLCGYLIVSGELVVVHEEEHSVHEEDHTTML